MAPSATCNPMLATLFTPESSVPFLFLTIIDSSISAAPLYAVLELWSICKVAAGVIVPIPTEPPLFTVNPVVPSVPNVIVLSVEAEPAFPYRPCVDVVLLFAFTLSCTGTVSPPAFPSNIVGAELVCPSDTVGLENVTTSLLLIVIAVASALDDIPSTPPPPETTKSIVPSES